MLVRWVLRATLNHKMSYSPSVPYGFGHVQCSFLAVLFWFFLAYL